MNTGATGGQPFQRCDPAHLCALSRRSLFHLLVLAPLAAIMGKTKTDPLAAAIADAPSGFKVALARYRAAKPQYYQYDGGPLRVRGDELSEAVAEIVRTGGEAGAAFSRAHVRLVLHGDPLHPDYVP